MTAVAQTAGSCDSGAAGSTLSFAVVVLNTPPVLSGTSSPLPYNENDVAIPVDPGVLVTDNEDIYLQSANI